MKLSAGTCPTKAVWLALFALVLFSAASRAADTAGESARPNSGVAYTTTFDSDENPLSEGGKWIHNGLEWAKIRKSGGIASQAESPRTAGGAHKHHNIILTWTLAFGQES